jgi:hypothetical protein
MAVPKLNLKKEKNQNKMQAKKVAKNLKSQSLKITKMVATISLLKSFLVH